MPELLADSCLTECDEVKQLKLYVQASCTGWVAGLYTLYVAQLFTDNIEHSLFLHCYVNANSLYHTVSSMMQQVMLHTALM